MIIKKINAMIQQAVRKQRYAPVPAPRAVFAPAAGAFCPVTTAPFIFFSPIKIAIHI